MSRNKFGVEHICIVHKDRREIIYTCTAPGGTLDPAFLEAFQQAVTHEEIELPGSEGDITQATIKGKFAVIRSGKFEYVAVILNTSPVRFTREALHAFGIKFSSRWARELKTFYTDLKGDVSVFQRRTPRGGNVDDLVEDNFHLTSPPSRGMPPERFHGVGQVVWNNAVDLARGKDYLLLRELLRAAGNILPPFIAYLLITVDPGDRPAVLKDLRSRSEVSEAWIVEGDCDLVARVVVPGLRQLGTLVMHLRRNPHILKTTTLIAQVDF